MLASDGRCKTLDASADGYVRAEDCVILMLEEASAALEAQVLLSGSAINQVIRFLRTQAPGTIPLSMLQHLSVMMLPWLESSK